MSVKNAMIHGIYLKKMVSSHQSRCNSILCGPGGAGKGRDLHNLSVQEVISLRMVLVVKH